MVEIRDVVTLNIKDDFNKEIVEPPENSQTRFSLPGVQQKFSLTRRDDRFHIPINGELGDFILKPQPTKGKLPNIVINEYFHMRLASLCGLNIPEIGLISIGRDSLYNENFLRDTQLSEDDLCFYIKRFDRDDNIKIHMEELHQALRIEGVITNNSKYEDFSFAEVIEFLNKVDKKYHSDLLIGYLKELSFSMLIGNADFHLKNSAFIYPDRINPKKAPSYDILNTEFYGFHQLPLELGIKGYSNIVADFDENTFEALLQESSISDSYLSVYSDMKQSIKAQYKNAFQDLVFKEFCNKPFKQKLIENFEKRFGN